MWMSRKRVCGLPGVKDKSCLKTCEERERENVWEGCQWEIKRRVSLHT